MMRREIREFASQKRLVQLASYPTRHEGSDHEERAFALGRRLIRPLCKKPTSVPLPLTIAIAPTPFSFMTACAESSVVEGSTKNPGLTGRITVWTRVAAQRALGTALTSSIDRMP